MGETEWHRERIRLLVVLSNWMTQRSQDRKLKGEEGK